MGMKEHFTRAEAEAVLPRLEPLLRALRDLRARHVALEERLTTGQAKILGNGHGQQNNAALVQQMREIEREIGERVEAVAQYGSPPQGYRDRPGRLPHLPRPARGLSLLATG